MTNLINRHRAFDGRHNCRVYISTYANDQATNRIEKVAAAKLSARVEFKVSTDGA
jgi:hypothetical protein